MRIIFMVPVYAVSSFLSLIFPHDAIYFDTVRIWCGLPHSAASRLVGVTTQPVACIPNECAGPRTRGRIMATDTVLSFVPPAVMRRL